MSTRGSGKNASKRKGKRAPRASSSAPWAESARARPAGRVRSWFASKGPVFRLVVMLGGLFGAFNVLFNVWLSKAEFFEVYLGLNAAISAAVLRVLGHDVTASGTSLGSSMFSMQVLPGCDAMQSTAFLITAVLVSPVRVSLAARLPYLIAGTLFLLLLNIVRIVSLYFSGVYYPRTFDVLHADFWQSAFILLPLVLWLMWVRWSQRQRMEAAHVSA